MQRGQNYLWDVDRISSCWCGLRLITAKKYPWCDLTFYGLFHCQFPAPLALPPSPLISRHAHKHWTISFFQQHKDHLCSCAYHKTKVAFKGLRSFQENQMMSESALFPMTIVKPKRCRTMWYSMVILASNEGSSSPYYFSSYRPAEAPCTESGGLIQWCSGHPELYGWMPSLGLFDWKQVCVMWRWRPGR